MKVNQASLLLLVADDCGDDFDDDDDNSYVVHLQVEPQSWTLAVEFLADDVVKRHLQILNMLPLEFPAHPKIKEYY